MSGSRFNLADLSGTIGSCFTFAWLGCLLSASLPDMIAYVSTLAVACLRTNPKTWFPIVFFLLFDEIFVQLGEVWRKVKQTWWWWWWSLWRWWFSWRFCAAQRDWERGGTNWWHRSIQNQLEHTCRGWLSRCPWQLNNECLWPQIFSLYRSSHSFSVAGVPNLTFQVYCISIWENVPGKGGGLFIHLAILTSTFTNQTSNLGLTKRILRSVFGCLTSISSYCVTQLKLWILDKLSSSIFCCLSISSGSGIGDTRPKLQFFNIYRHKSPILTLYHQVSSSTKT